MTMVGDDGIGRRQWRWQKTVVMMRTDNGDGECRHRTRRAEVLLWHSGLMSCHTVGNQKHRKRGEMGRSCLRL